MLYNINIIIDYLIDMRNIQILAVLVMLLLSLFIPCTLSANETTMTPMGSNQYKDGYRNNVQGWIYVHIQGNAYERGYQHGYLLSAEIVDMLTRWSNIIHNFPGLALISKRLSDARFEKMSETWWNFCTKECYRLYWDKFPVEYQDEIRGIADGVTARGGKIHGRNVNSQDILAMNEMYEFLSKLEKIPKGIHPLRTFFQQLQQVVPEIEHLNASTVIEMFLSQPPAHHCNGFIASGNATSHGQLVFAQTTICGGGMWWWTYYISLRWNVILDIQPSIGHRIIMPTSPGLIWSDEDYYQNDNGLVLLETTALQGLYDNKGLPLSVRARTAMQYGNSIDDMLFSLRYRNDGSMNAVWLLGDTKTGEIARLDLGYRHAEVWRTFNGFYWSSNNPRNLLVRLERINVKDFTLNFIAHYFLKSPLWGFYSFRYFPEARDLKFEELGKKYYGHIDVEIAKQIMHTPPISKWITDAKATDSDLMKHNGLWAFFGNPHRPLNLSDVGSRQVKTEIVPPAGWVLLFGIPVKTDFTLVKKSQERIPGIAEVLWTFDTTDDVNNFTSYGTIDNHTLYEATSTGVLFSINATSGGMNWRTAVGEKPSVPTVYNGQVFVGSIEGVSIFTTDGEKQRQVVTDGRVRSRPVIIEDTVVFGDSLGNVYSIVAATGQEQRRLNVSNESHISSTYNENIYLTSGNRCYAIGRNNHTIVWTFPTNGMITSAPTLNNHTVYFSSWDTYVYAVDAKTGALRWKYQAGWGFDSSPVVSKDELFACSMDNNLYCVNPDGTLRWIFTANAALHTTPVPYGSRVFFGSDDGRVYAVNRSSGEAVWSFTPGYSINGVTNYVTTPIVSNIVVSNGSVYVGANGIIYGLNAGTFEAPPDVPQKETETSPFVSGTSTNGSVWILPIIVVPIIILFMVAVLRKKK